MLFLLCDMCAGTGSQRKHFSKLENRAININGFFFQKASERLNRFFFSSPPSDCYIFRNAKEKEGTGIEPGK